MGYTTIICLSITIAAILFGTIFGIVRGLKRSILRLVIVIGSLVGAFFLREIVADFIFGIEINGITIKNHILSVLSTGDVSLPASMQNVIVALVDIIGGILCYLLLFYLIRFISWLTIFPICKIFVKRGDKKHPWLGALFGLVQGLLVAFCVLSPITGLLVQVDEVSKLEYNGAPLFKIDEKVGIREYHESFLGKTYIKIGDWYFNLMASTETEDGTVVNIHDSVDIVSTALHFLESFNELSDDFVALEQPETTHHQKAESLSQIGDKLIEMGNNMDSLSEEAKTIVNDIIDDVVDMIPTEELPESIATLVENFTIEEANLVGVGESVKGISNFIDKVEITNTPEDVTQEDVDNIVHGLSLNPAITNSLASIDGGLLDVSEMGFEQEFMTAIDNVEDAEMKANLLKLFGLN